MTVADKIIKLHNWDVAWFTVDMHNRLECKMIHRFYADKNITRLISDCLIKNNLKVFNKYTDESLTRIEKSCINEFFNKNNNVAVIYD